MRKNVAGQVIGAELIAKADGTPVTTGTTNVYVTGDGGVQGGTGTATHEGNGLWTYLPTQAETNYTHVAFTFVNTSAINVTIQVYTTGYDPTVANLPANAIQWAGIATATDDVALATAPTNFSALSITAAGLVDITQAAADKVWATAARTLTSFGTLVADIWGYSTRTLTAFSTALALSVWDVLESAILTASSIGLKVKNNLDATITSRHASGAAVASVSGNVDGNVTGTIGSLAAQAKTDVNDQVVDGISVDTYVEPPQGSPGQNLSIATKIGYLFKAWRNRKTQSSSQYNLYNDDVVTIDQKATFSDDGTTADRGEIISGP